VIRYQQIDALRGLAALAVVICHFRHGFAPELIPTLKLLGNLGVFLFFVISGYIIPRILASSHYQIDRLGVFLWRRLLRLHPPFLAALGISLAATLVAAQVKGTSVPWSLLSILQYVFYLDFPAENPVVWTLQVEMCFYVFIGLTFPLINDRRPVVRWGAFLAIAAMGFAGGLLLFLKFLGFFLVGISLEQYERKAVSAFETLVKLGFSLGLCAMNTDILGASTALLALAVINLGEALRWPRWVLYLGTISYSLYLLHFPIGVKLLNWGFARFTEIPRIGMVATVFTCTVVIATLFYRWVEKPSMRFAALRGALAS